MYSRRAVLGVATDKALRDTLEYNLDVISPYIEGFVEQDCQASLAGFLVVDEDNKAIIDEINRRATLLEGVDWGQIYSKGAA